VSAPRLGILDSHPIQYHSPLYQRLASRGRVRLSVLYIRQDGLRPVLDPGFGVPICWDIDLLGGYQADFLAGPGRHRLRRAVRLGAWLAAQDVVVIHGYASPWMLLAASACRGRGVPYLIRSDAQPRGRSAGARGLPGRLRRSARHGVAQAVVSASAGGLAIGSLNAEFYRKHGARSVVFAPHSVDNDRFAGPPPDDRAGLLTRWGLDHRRPVLMFCGKLTAAKRPLDLAAAASTLSEPVNVLFVGDGALADPVRATLGSLGSRRGVVTGFVNQAELPSYYHAADVFVLPSQFEPWGLVVNEAMAAGVLPVVSDRVGAAPDLVDGVGEVYRCADVAALAGALRRALARAADPGTAGLVRGRVAQYGLDVTAAGFEQAAARAAGIG
jgi:glycosyltransferase involved in cell wall biosynthesis